MPTLTADDVLGRRRSVDDWSCGRAPRHGREPRGTRLGGDSARITNDEAPMKTRDGRFASGRVAELIDILEAAVEDEPRPRRRCDQARAAKRPWSLIGAHPTLQGWRARLGVAHYLSFPSLRPAGPLSSGTSMSCSSTRPTGRRRRGGVPGPAGGAVLGAGLSDAVRRAPRFPPVPPVAAVSVPWGPLPCRDVPP